MGLRAYVHGVLKHSHNQQQTKTIKYLSLIILSTGLNIHQTTNPKQILDGGEEKNLPKSHVKKSNMVLGFMLSVVGLLFSG